MAQPSFQGSFVWQELMTADTAGAGAFYPKVLGWRTQSSPHSSSYSMFSTAAGPVAGMMRLPDDARQMGARPHWLPYLGADDVDATVAAAERAGAKVLHAASDIANNIGRFAVLSDPQGAAFGVYRPGQAMPSQPKGAPTPGYFSWHELATTDFEAAFEFYSKLFGWQAMQRMDMGPAGTYLVFGRDGVQRGGIYKLSAHTPVPYWLSYVEVGGADAVASAAREAGAQVVNGPMDVPGGGRIAQLMDPGGVLFAVHSAAKAAAAKPVERKPTAAAPAESASVAKSAAVRSHRPEREPAHAPTSAAPKADSGKSAAATPRASASGRSAPASQSKSARPTGAKRLAGSKAAAKKATAKRTGKKAASKKAAGKKAAAKKKPAAKKKSGGRAKRAGRGGAKRARGAARRAGRTGGARSGKKAARGGGGSTRRRRSRRK